MKIKNKSKVTRTILLSSLGVCLIGLSSLIFVESSIKQQKDNTLLRLDQNQVDTKQYPDYNPVKNSKKDMDDFLKQNPNWWKKLKTINVKDDNFSFSHTNSNPTIKSTPDRENCQYQDEVVESTELLPNRVNDEYLQYIKYNINYAGNVNAETRYADLIRSNDLTHEANLTVNKDGKKETYFCTPSTDFIYSDQVTLETQDDFFTNGVVLNETYQVKHTNDYDGNIDDNNSKTIDLPLYNIKEHKRQWFGEINKDETYTDGLYTYVTISGCSSNLPTDSRQWSISDVENRNYSVANDGVIKTDTETGTEYKLKINGGIAKDFKIGLGVSNNYNIAIDVLKPKDKSPKLNNEGATANYDKQKKKITGNVSIDDNFGILSRDNINEYIRISDSKNTFYNIDFNDSKNLVTFTSISEVDEKDLPDKIIVDLLGYTSFKSTVTITPEWIKKDEQGKKTYFNRSVDEMSVNQNNDISLHSQSSPLSPPPNDSGTPLNDVLQNENPDGSVFFDFDLDLKDIQERPGLDNHSLSLSFNKIYKSTINLTFNQNLDNSQATNILEEKNAAAGIVEFASDKNTIDVWYPNLQPVYDYFIKSIANDPALRLDNNAIEYYINNDENFKGKDITINQILFLTNDEKARFLKYHYKNVINKLLLDSSSSNSSTNLFPDNIIPSKFKPFKDDNENNKFNEDKYQTEGITSDQIYAFKPLDWDINVSIENDNCYLSFTYKNFDGNDVLIGGKNNSQSDSNYVIKTKLFLNNPDHNDSVQSDWNQPGQADLKLNEKPTSFNLNKEDTKIQYADQFYDLINNVEANNILLDSIIAYRNEKNTSNEPPLSNAYEYPKTNPKGVQDYNHIIETRFTKDQFWNQLSPFARIFLNYTDQQWKNRTIYFDSINDETGEEYNSLASLAANGSIKFDINFGEDLKSFFLNDYVANETQDSFTYIFNGLKTQYDFYCLDNPNNEPFELTNVSEIDLIDDNYIEQSESEGWKLTEDGINWVLDNLFLYDNQSIWDSTFYQQIKPNTYSTNKPENSSKLSQNRATNKIIATNLERKEDILLKAKPDNPPFITVTSYDRASGTLGLSITLNLGDAPSDIKKDRVKTIANNQERTFKLITNPGDNGNNNFTYNITLTGFKKAYDLNIPIDQKEYDVNDISTEQPIQKDINTIVNDLNSQSQAPSNLESIYLKNLIQYKAFDTVWNKQTYIPLLKTRLTEEEFNELVGPIIYVDNEQFNIYPANTIVKNNNLDYFSGKLHATLDFRNRENALIANYHTQTDYKELTKNDIPIKFVITNLNRQIIFGINEKFQLNDENNQTVDLKVPDSKYIPSYVANLLKNEEDKQQVIEGLFAINVSSNNDVINLKNSNKLFYVNAFDYESLANSIQITSNPNDAEGYLDLTVTFKLNPNDKLYYNIKDPSNLGQSVSEFSKTFRIRGFDKNTGISLDKVNPISIKDINKAFNTNFRFPNDIDNEWILRNLIIYKGQQVDPKKPYLINFNSKELTTKGISISSYEQLQTYLVKNNEITRTMSNKDELSFAGTINFIPSSYTNSQGQKVNNVNFILNDFDIQANTNWKISQGEIININDYINVIGFSVDKFDSDFILTKMMIFLNQTNISKPILDNSAVSLEDFKSQINLNFKIEVVNSKEVNVSISTKRITNNNLNMHANTFDSINFKVVGFDEKSNFNKQLVVIIASVGGSGLLVIFFIILISMFVHQQRKMRRKEM